MTVDYILEMAGYFEQCDEEGIARTEEDKVFCETHQVWVSPDGSWCDWLDEGGEPTTTIYDDLFR